MTRSSTRPSGLLPAPLERLLECASLREDLGSLVLYDVPAPLLEQVAEAWLGNLAVLGGRARRVQLGPWTTEEDLWGLDESLPKEWRRPGLLDSAAPRLVVIPDLARLSLAALRACVSWMGAEHVSVERVGQVRRFRPQCYWLAGCSLAEVGEVSPHLLDRFALRVRAPSMPGNATEVLLRALEPAPRKPSRKKEGLDVLKSSQLRRAAQVQVQMTDEARAAILQRFPPMAGAGHRGLLTLGRMASALAQLTAAAPEVARGRPVELRAAQVQEAARLLQLPAPVEEAAPTPKPPELPSAPSAPLLGGEEAQPPVSGVPPLLEPPPVIEPEGNSLPAVTVVSAQVSPAEAQPSAALPPLEVERTTPIQREHAPLRLPFAQGGVSATGRGAVIGVQPARDMQDLAIVSSLLAAAPYQRLRRRKSRSRRKGLLLTRSDLRAYRRAPVPQHLLALVLDFTSLTEGWQQALMPYLSEAYVERAQVCVIQVGARGDESGREESELRARRVMGRSLLVPAVARALEAEPGQATPLADGLDLALATLRRALRVGRAAAHHAWLVVVTDGRGNIPLKASQTGHLQPPVGRQGVEDALQVAAQLRGMRQVAAVVLRPPLASLKELPVQLADALGARLVDFGPPEQAEGGASP